MPTVTGAYERIDGAPVIRFERTFPHPVDAVWSAITDPAELERWFPTTVQFTRLAVGEPIAFRFAGDAYPPMTGQFTEVDPPRRLAFTWGDDVLAFELSAAGPAEAPGSAPACRLSFTVALDDAAKAARDGAGWDQCLDMLAVVAGGGAPPRPAHSADWEDYYAQYKARGFPASAEILAPPER